MYTIFFELLHFLIKLAENISETVQKTRVTPFTHKQETVEETGLVSSNIDSDNEIEDEENEVKMEG